jgi:hypothetical protein
LLEASPWWLEYLKQTARRGAVSAPALNPRRYVTRKEHDDTLVTIGKWAGGIIRPLEKRIAELESREFRFLGSWSEGLDARAGNAVAHDGSTWIAIEKTSKKPGTADSGWILAAKRGRDGRDAAKGK